MLPYDGVLIRQWLSIFWLPYMPPNPCILVLSLVSLRQPYTASYLCLMAVVHMLNHDRRLRELYIDLRFSNNMIQEYVCLRLRVINGDFQNTLVLIFDRYIQVS
jgi:hypothetical protein